MQASPSQLQAADMGNAAAGVMADQVLIPGQVALRGMGIGRIPVVNIENACRRILQWVLDMLLASDNR
jgi:hypothetical protein